MKYYSEVLGKTYATEKECLTAEAEYQAEVERKKKAQEEARAKEVAKREQQAAERKQAAAEVDAAFKVLQDARTEYSKKLTAFCEKYGTYHTSLTTKDIDTIPSLFDIFRLF